MDQPIQAVAGGVLLRLRVQPRASRDEVVGLHGDAVRIRLRAPPVDGAANEALVRFLSEQLQVPRSTVQLTSGQTSRSKVVMITGADLEQVRFGLRISSSTKARKRGSTK
jgi:uncharacterized protein (TIGR00251 family)